MIFEFITALIEHVCDLNFFEVGNRFLFVDLSRQPEKKL